MVLSSSLTDICRAPANPGKPSTDPPDSSLYTQVLNSPNDTTNLTSYPLTDAVVDEGRVYFARVQYKDNTTIESDFSDWSEFKAKDSFVPDFGSEFRGGYFGGQINDSGTIYNLIVCPLTENTLEGQYGGVTPETIENMTLANPDNEAFVGLTYGGAGTVQYADSTHTMFNWCINGSTGPNAGTYDATNSIGSGIGGKNDWYIPALHEMWICYFGLKPTTGTNDTSGSNGSNPDSVSPYTPNTTFGPNFPSRTSAPAFQAGGSQAWTAGNYWTASQFPGVPKNAYFVGWSNGGRLNQIKTGSLFARAIRREAA